jgi:hypothetical protein
MIICSGKDVPIPVRTNEFSRVAACFYRRIPVLLVLDGGRLHTRIIMDEQV